MSTTRPDPHPESDNARRATTARAPIPDDIKATILEMCQVIDKGSTSALFGRIHDVRKWICER